MNVGVIAGRAAGLDGNVLLLLSQLLKAIVNRLRDQRALLYPAFRATCRAHSGKAAFTLEDLNAIAVFHHARLVEHGGDMVAKNSLRGRDVSDFLHPSPTAAATGEQERQHQRDQ